MINVVALFLVTTSLVAGGLWSPIGDNPIVKEGHRVVVVEYDLEGKQSTKVSISPESDQVLGHRFNIETDSVPASLRDGGGRLGRDDHGGGGGEDDHAQRRCGPKELICNAYGECVHKIAEAVGKTKDAVAGKARRAGEAAYDKTVHGMEEAYDKAKEGALGARDIGKTMKVDVAKNVTGFLARVKREVAHTAAVAGQLVSPTALNPISGTIYILAFSTAFGTGMWVTFVLSHVLAAALPRQQFGVVQSKVYPVYFRWMAVSIATALFWFAMSHRGVLSVKMPELFQVYNLLASLVLVLINAHFLEPRATKVMFEKMKLEKEEGRGREESEQSATPPESEPCAGGASERREQDRITNLGARLKKLNTWSSCLNILTLMSLCWHVYYLGERLHITF